MLSIRPKYRSTFYTRISIWNNFKFRRKRLKNDKWRYLYIRQYKRIINYRYKRYKRLYKYKRNYKLKRYKLRFFHAKQFRYYFGFITKKCLNDFFFKVFKHQQLNILYRTLMYFERRFDILLFRLKVVKTVIEAQHYIKSSYFCINNRICRVHTKIVKDFDSVSVINNVKIRRRIYNRLRRRLIQYKQYRHLHKLKFYAFYYNHLEFKYNCLFGYFLYKPYLYKIFNLIPMKALFFFKNRYI